MIKVMSIHITGRAMDALERQHLQVQGKLEAWRESLIKRMESEIAEVNAAFEDGYKLLSSDVVETDGGKAFWLLLHKPDSAPGLLDELMNAAIPPKPLSDHKESSKLPAPIITQNQSTPPKRPVPVTEALNIDMVLESGDYVILDTETTGLKGEILQIAIVDSKGNTLLNTLLQPKREIEPGATAVHGITADMVKGYPTYPDLLTQLKEILTGQNVIVYNAKFDREMLHLTAEAWGLPKVEWKELAMWYCAMERFASIYGDWNSYHQSYRWQKLSTAASYYGIPVVNAHDALGDCLMTLEVCRAMVKTGFNKKGSLAS